MGKSLKGETGEMEPERGRAMERKGAEKRRESIEERRRERLGDGREAKLGGRERGSGAERWGESEEGRGREQGERRDSRRRGERGEEAGKWERRTWRPQGLPEVQGTRIPLGAQPARASLCAPRGAKKEEAAARTRRSWGGWPRQNSSSQLPETPPTRLPRMQQEVEPLSASALGTPSMHREAGIPSLSVCLSVCEVGRGEGGGGEGSVGIVFMH